MSVTDALLHPLPHSARASTIHQIYHIHAHQGRLSPTFLCVSCTNSENSFLPRQCHPLCRTAPFLSVNAEGFAIGGDSLFFIGSGVSGLRSWQIFFVPWLIDMIWPVHRYWELFVQRLLVASRAAHGTSNRTHSRRTSDTQVQSFCRSCDRTFDLECL
jgi:hypothetical protein